MFPALAGGFFTTAPPGEHIQYITITYLEKSCWSRTNVPCEGMDVGSTMLSEIRVTEGKVLYNSTSMRALELSDPQRRKAGWRGPGTGKRCFGDRACRCGKGRL